MNDRSGEPAAGSALPVASSKAMRLKNVLAGTSRLLARITQVTVIIMSFGMMGSLILGVFFRYVIGTALSWSGELAMFLFTWLIFLAGSLGVREGFHSRLVFVRDKMPTAGKYWIEVFVNGAVIVFGLILLYAGFRYLNQTMGQVSAAIHYPIEALNAAAIAGGGLIIVHAAARIACETGAPQESKPHE
jgi:TRAP-type C4-dicarboxylate transport system permease small subunit